MASQPDAPQDGIVMISDDPSDEPGETPDASFEQQLLQRVARLEQAHRNELAEVTSVAEARVAEAHAELDRRSAELAELTRLLDAEVEQGRRELGYALDALQGEAMMYAAIVVELRGGSRRSRRATPTAPRELEAAADILRGSVLFSSEWYLTKYPDVARAGVDPVLHYIRSGAAEGRDPSLAFSTELYLSAYPDVAEARVNPLVHYEAVGRREGRTFFPTRPVTEA